MNRCVRCGRPTPTRLCGPCGGAAGAPGPTLPNVASFAPSRSTAPPQRSVGGGNGWSPRALPALASRGPSTYRREPGEIITTPSVAASPPGVEERLGLVVVLLLLLAVITNPVLLGALAFWLVILLAIAWVAGRVGLLGPLSLLLGISRAGRGSTRWQPPTLAFRCQFAHEVREVRLRGHDAGIQLGDQVEVSGLAVRGIIGASQVRNLSSGAVLRRHRLARLVTLSILAGWLLLTVIAQVAG